MIDNKKKPARSMQTKAGLLRLCLTWSICMFAIIMVASMRISWPLVLCASTVLALFWIRHVIFYIIERR